MTVTYRDISLKEISFFASNICATCRSRLRKGKKENEKTEVKKTKMNKNENENEKKTVNK